MLEEDTKGQKVFILTYKTEYIIIKREGYQHGRANEFSHRIDA